MVHLFPSISNAAYVYYQSQTVNAISAVQCEPPVNSADPLLRNFTWQLFVIAASLHRRSSSITFATTTTRSSIYNTSLGEFVSFWYLMLVHVYRKVRYGAEQIDTAHRCCCTCDSQTFHLAWRPVDPPRQVRRVRPGLGPRK